VLAIETIHESDVIMLALRVIVGLTLAAHGYQKVFKGGKIPGTAAWFQSMGMKPNGKVHAIMAATTEITTGVLLAAGLLTTFAAMGMVGLMTVAGYTVHRGNFFIVKNGWEYNMVIATIATAIAGFGPGQLSLDNALGIAGRLDGYTGVAIAGIGGLSAGITLLALAYRPPAESN
jgi:putative oxidoreductase